jgi:hypothetical protein
MPEPPPFPVGQTPAIGEMADWVEFVTLSRETPFKRGDLQPALAQENIDDADTTEQDVWHELERRGDLFGQNWPLRISGNRITRRRPSPVPLALYRFLCLLSFGPLEGKDRTLFEVVVAMVISPFTGRPGLHIGAPASKGMDPSFRERVKRYGELSGLLPTEIKAAPLSDDKDLGVDAVTWFSFADPRGAHLHFLVQCATGEDWEDKLHDIDLKVWQDHIAWGVSPVRAFAVPLVLALPEAKWVRTARKGGLILDRPRLIELARRCLLPPALKTQLTARVRILSAV